MDTRVLFTAYEQDVLAEIADHTVHPNPVQVVLNRAEWSADKVIQRLGDARSQLVQKTLTTVAAGVQQALIHTIGIGHRLGAGRTVAREFARQGVTVRDVQAIAGLSDVTLAVMDQVADSFDLSNAMPVGAEVLIMGACINLSELVPGLVSAAVFSDE